MSRAEYSENLSNWDLIRWRGAVASAIRGKRGQAFLLEMQVVLDAMPIKELIAGDLQDETGHVCALGSVGAARNADMSSSEYDPYDYERLAKTFLISPALIREIEYINDECAPSDPQSRWKYVYRWVNENLIKQ